MGEVPTVAHQDFLEPPKKTLLDRFMVVVSQILTMLSGDHLEVTEVEEDQIIVINFLHSQKITTVAGAMDTFIRRCWKIPGKI